MSIRVFAPAKINLTLQVGRPRADGMHPLQSVVVFADAADWIEAEASDDLNFRIVGAFKHQLSEGDQENLVLRAARALARAAGVPPHAAITLEKNLPVASGVGGGSADAAATLRALSRLWTLDLDAGGLQEIARALGADVPVCLSGAPAYMTGIGADWRPLETPALPAVLVNPGKELATTLVYRAFDRMRLGARFAPAPPPGWGSRAEALTGIAAIGNDLAAPAAALVPEIGVVSEFLRNDARTLYAAMSGSGATVFALVDSLSVARALAADILASHPTWWVTPTLLGGA